MMQQRADDRSVALDSSKSTKRREPVASCPGTIPHLTAPDSPGENSN